MAKAYLVAQIDVTDSNAYMDYVKKVPATTAQYGGRYLVRGGKLEALEGAAPRSRVVVIEFPTFEQAKAWYDSEEYAPIKAIRLGASEGDVFLVEGT